jgi:hypothetical protein
MLLCSSAGSVSVASQRPRRGFPSLP